MQYRPKKRFIPLDSAAWLKLRAQVLADEPLCRFCFAAGYTTPATDVDHIKNGVGDHSDDNSRDNLQPLCRACHSRKTRAEMLGESVQVRGCDINGIPLDPSHPWRQP